MRLGAKIFERFTTPDEWVAAVRAHGYSAAYCPVGEKEDAAVIRAYERAAQAAGLVIAEVGAWSNPISPNETTRREAVAYCQKRLALADDIGARCCVNIAGSVFEENGSRSPHADNYTGRAFDLIVDSVRSIIDAVKPTRTCYALEMMPWVPPDSPDSYLKLLRAIDRPQFAVHLDPANIINSPQRYCSSGRIIRECFRKLGPYIKSCHAKDTIMRNTMTLHIDEIIPGQGVLDYRAFLTELNKLDADTPLMLEHLRTTEEYDQAAAYVRSVAIEAGVTIKAA